MLQRGEDAGFALKAGEPIGIVGEEVRQNLEGHIIIQDALWMWLENPAVRMERD